MGRLFEVIGAALADLVRPASHEWLVPHCPVCDRPLLSELRYYTDAETGEGLGYLTVLVCLGRDLPDPCAYERVL